MDQPTIISGIQFQNKLMNAAYIGSKTAEDIDTLLLSSNGAVVVGSISVNPRTPNSGRGYWRHKEGFYSLNSYGMPNGGISYFSKELPKIVKKAHIVNKPVIANIIGFNKRDWPILLALAENSGADMVELNFGCPNVWNGSKQKGIISYHPERIQEILELVKSHKPAIKISVKISPLPPDILQEAARVIVECGVVQAITATNSYPNAMVNSGTKFDDEPDLAGLGGRSLKPISLGVVKQLHELLPKHVDIIGCGGVSSVNDVNDYLRAGAKAVQIATALVDEGPSIFKRILEP